MQMFTFYFQMWEISRWKDFHRRYLHRQRWIHVHSLSLHLVSQGSIQYKFVSTEEVLLPATVSQIFCVSNTLVLQLVGEAWLGSSMQPFLKL